MATYLGTSAVFEVRSTATAGNLGGGGFNPQNANFLTDGAATLATGNSPVFTSVSYNFVAGDVGAWLYIKSGTSWTAGWYQIASVAANAATLSAAVGQGVQISNNRYITQTVAGCATTASPTGATWGIDYSQKNAAQFTSTDLTGTTTACTSTAHPFGVQQVGNFICISTGTGVTAGWYEIVSVSGVTATLDRTAGTSYSACTYYLGGAVSLGGSTTGITDVIFFALGASSTTSGCVTFIKGGSSITYTLQNTPITTLAGNAAWCSIVEGYASIRGDRPRAATRPTLACATNLFTQGASNILISLQFTSTTTSTTGAVAAAAKCMMIDVKSTLSTSTAGRKAIAFTGANAIAIRCEAISYRGIAFYSVAAGVSFIGCYGHDSNYGFDIDVASPNLIINCISCSNVTGAVTIGTAASGSVLYGNTFYGAENKLGTGFSDVTATNTIALLNNIFYGFTTGVNNTDVSANTLDDYNDYNNNTNDVNAAANWQKGANSIATNPSFTSVTQRTGVTATTTAGNHLVQSGATFVTWGITAGVDCVYISAGTGITAGIYGILSVDSETQITVDITLTANATADKTWSITQGHNFAVGLANTTGYPGAFPAGLTTGYLAIGAAQPQGSAGTTGSAFS